MSSEPTIPPTTEEREEVATSTTVTAAPQVVFSTTRWASTGVIRVLYRLWTRVAVVLFPEDSPGEQIAQALHIPLPDRLNMSWITGNLAVGGRVHPEDIKALARAGVTHVVDTRSEYCDDRKALESEHIGLLYLPTPDTYPLTVEQLLEGAIWSQQHIKGGGRVLIHCEHGVGRSVLLACAVLVYGGMHAHDALQLVQQKRWQASPNHRQVMRLQEFEALYRSQAKA